MKNRKKWGVLTTAFTALMFSVGITACGGSGPAAHVHSFGADNVCAGCKEVWHYTEGLEYTLQSNNTYCVVGIGEASGDVVIPYGYNGLAVAAVENSAFNGCSLLTGIVIPDSVTYLGERVFEQCTALTNAVIGNKVARIGYYTFGNCTALSSVTIGDSVGGVDSWAFFGCTELTSIEVSSGNAKYRSEGNCLIDRATDKLVLGCKASVIPNGVTAIGYQAFYACTALTSITIPNSVTLIDDWAFSGCSALTEIVLPHGLTSIGSSAFSSCESITNLVISDSVTSIGNWAFSGCTGLACIEVASGNTVYRSEGNCLIESATNTLILGCKASVIPGSVTTIGEAAFYRCIGLTSIVIPNGVTSIGAAAFNSCSTLKSIVISDSVTFIGNEAFRNCDGLETVYYEGTEQDWDAMTIGDNENAHFIAAARYYFSETPNYDGRHWHYDTDGVPVIWQEA